MPSLLLVSLDPSPHEIGNPSGNEEETLAAPNPQQAQTMLPNGPAITGMSGGVLIGRSFVAATLAELRRLGTSKTFVLANSSSRALCMPLVSALEQEGQLACPLCTSIGMGGGETGLLAACDLAASVGADSVVTVGGGAVQDAGKLIRLWLSGATSAATATAEPATVAALIAMTSRDPFPPLPPQIAVPNSFAMAELTSVAGVTTAANVKSGASHPALMPTTVIVDPSLAETLPDWVRFGTALRCVEHAVGAITHPKATEEIRKAALQGLALVRSGLAGMLKEPASHAAMMEVYTGGWFAVRALNSNGCYPAVGHLLENIYSARYSVHQGACSGILCARLLAYHQDASAGPQARIAAVLAGDSPGSDGAGDGAQQQQQQQHDSKPPLSAARLVANLVATLPGVAKDHADAGVDVATLAEFAEALPLARLNALCPRPFATPADLHAMMTLPLDQIA